VSCDPTFDRRRYPRVRSESLISIAPLDLDTALAHALDLSLSGVRFRCVGLEVKERELVKITLTFGERSVTVVGQVLRAEWIDTIAQEIALSFLKMSDETREFLHESLPATGERSGDERRALARIQLDSVVAVSRASVSDVLAQAQDVSTGGIHFVVEDLELRLGDVLRVTLDCDGVPVSAVGQLVRVTEVGDSKQEAALVFLTVEERVAERLRDFLTREAPVTDSDLD